jgi:undecaprenyl-diphosphatase
MKPIKKWLLDHTYGVYLTIGILITLFFVYLFFGIVEDYVGREKIIQSDIQTLNFVSTFRTVNLNQIMIFITDLGNGITITIAVIILSLIFIFSKKWRFLKALLTSVIVGQIFVWIIKNIIERPRPPITNALVSATSYSFPSGHAFVAISFYGLLTFFIIQSVKNKLFKIIIFLVGLILIISIGFSRIYLGVHWPSDVFASFAAGVAWLSVIITSLKIRNK